MKFRDFIGEPKLTKKIVKTNIGPTEEDFLKKVLRENPDGSKIDNTEFYLGFYISKKPLKRVYDYIKSWFLRYKIPFKSVNPYLTLYLLKNLPRSKKELVEEIKSKNKNVVFSTIEEGNILIVDGKTIEVRLEYNPNNDFIDELEKIFEKKYIEIIGKYCYIKLFEIETIPNEKLLEDMCYSMSRFPKINLNNIGIKKK